MHALLFLLGVGTIGILHVSCQSLVVCVRTSNIVGNWDPSIMPLCVHVRHNAAHTLSLELKGIILVTCMGTGQGLQLLSWHLGMLFYDGTDYTVLN